MAEFVEIKSLEKYSHVPRGEVHAVDDVFMVIGHGGTMGVVGESGCGKSILGRILVCLEEASGGQILLQGQDITGVRGRILRQSRENAQMILQDLYSSLNPRSTVEQTMQEPLIVSGKLNRKEIEEKTKELIDLVGVVSRLKLSYSHELDGGRKQRMGITRALTLDPEFIVCDEPVSALGVSTQAQALNLLQDLQQQKKPTYLFITHGLSVVRYISNHISVTYLGQLVGACRSGELFARQLHPRTKALLPAIPTTDIDKKMERTILRGEITSSVNPKLGCRSVARCVYTTPEYRRPQTLTELEPGHFVSCWRARGISG